MRLPFLSWFLVLLAPSAVWARGSLTVSVVDERSRPVEGTVSVAPQGGGAARNCTTRGGQCSVRRLAAGWYRVTAATARGQTPPAVVVAVRSGRNVRARLTVPLPSQQTETRPASATATTQGRDLGSGQHRVISGWTDDQRSRPVEGSVSVSRNGVLVGTVPTRGGRFQVYDLDPGRYRLSFTGLTGQSVAKEVAIQDGPAISVRLTVQR